MRLRAITDRLVIDASAMVDLLVGSPHSEPIQQRVYGHELHVPAHFDAEVLSALGRLQRTGILTTRQVTPRIDRLATAPIERHLLAPLLNGAWKRRHNLRLVDALYVELAIQLDSSIITTDAGLAAASPTAELVAE
jgi:predicted nucleic acid-binding protein